MVHITYSDELLKASKYPEEDIKLLAYPNQHPNRRMYRHGYEESFNELPILKDNDPMLGVKIEASHDIMKDIADRLKTENWWEPLLEEGEFKRTIIAIEHPETSQMIADVPETTYAVKAGPQLMVGHIGKGVATPIHGHSTGLMQEEMISGKLKIDFYHLVQPHLPIVRPTSTVVMTDGTVGMGYAKVNKDAFFEKQTRIHKLTALENSTLFVYFPSYSRDSIDSIFEVEYFDNNYDLTGKMKRITSLDGLYLHKGDVVLVRSSIASDYGTHYLIATGGSNKMLEVGLRPEATLISAPNAKIPAEYDNEEQVLLKLSEEARLAFYEFHNITFDANNNLIFQTS